MFIKSKKIGLICCIAVISSCSLFSSNKEIPQGTRISVLSQAQNTFAQELSGVKNVKISSPDYIRNWAQTASNASHLRPNVLTRPDIKKSWKESFGKGADSRNLLLAHPIVVNGIIYVQDVEGTLYAYNLKNGQKVFKQKLQPLNKNDSTSSMNGVGLAAAGGKIYALTGFGSVFAVEEETGRILWRKDLNVPLRIAPTASAGKLFIQTIDNQLLCLSSEDGSEIWSYNISAEDTVLAGGAVPAFDAAQEIVVAAFSNGEIQAFNARIGYPLWSNNLINVQQIGASVSINAVKASPVIDKNTVFAVGNNGLTMAINLENGDVLWQKTIGGTSTPVVDDQALFVLSNNFELLALEKETGEIMWAEPLFNDMSSKERLKLYVRGPVMINSELLITASNGTVLTFDARTGKQKTTLRLGDDLPFEPIAADGSVIFTTNEAKLIVYQ